MAVTGGDEPHRVASPGDRTRSIAARVLIGISRLGFLVLLASSTGCYKVPAGGNVISSVAIEGTKEVDAEDIAEHIATREAKTIFGFVYDAEPFDRYALRHDLARVERYMRARGFYDAVVRIARVVMDGDKVRVTIEVEEGKPVLVTEPVIVGDEGVEGVARERMRKAIELALPKGARLDEDQLAEAEKAAVKVLASRGHAGARVERHAEVDLATATARVTFTVTPGPVARVGAIQWKGAEELPEEKVRAVFGVKEGDVYSSDDLDDARQALLDLGVFASVKIAMNTKDLESTKVVPLTVTCEVTKLRAVLAGGGLEFDSLKTDVHGLIGWQNSNFLGGLRRFEVRFKPDRKSVV